MFSPLLSLFVAGKPLTYNNVLKAWQQSPERATHGRHLATSADIHEELKTLAAAGVLVEGKRGIRGTWKLAKR